MDTYTFVLIYRPDGSYALAQAPDVQYAYECVLRDTSGHATIAEIEACSFETAVEGIRSLWLN